MSDRALTVCAAVASMLIGMQPAPAHQQSASPSPPDRLVADADEAMRANRPAEAIALYRKALTARPRWAEGWWHLGRLLYEGNDYAEAAMAFTKATTLNPSAGTAWAMLGLCEFKLGRHDVALAHIQKGRSVGASAEPQFRKVLLYHEGLLLLGKAEFERAQETFGQLSAAGVDSDELVVGLGLAVLRVWPADMPEGGSPLRDLVSRAGYAEHLAARKQLDAARHEYERLTREFPRTRHVQYALGRHLAAMRQPEQAVAAYEREIENSPDHVPARLGIAAVLAQTDPARALPYAEKAVELNPAIPLGHYLLGSLLLHTPDTARAIAQLEIAERSVQKDPAVYYALGRAYARAGRVRDAARARATFRRLTEERQQAARRALDTPTTATEDTPQP